MRLCNEPRRSKHYFVVCSHALKASGHTIELVANLSSHDKKMGARCLWFGNGFNGALVVFDGHIDSFSNPLVCVVGECIDESS